MRPNRYLVLTAVAATVIALDQFTKELALSGLADGPVEVIDGALTFRLTFNSGGAFGLLRGLPGFFLIATVMVVAAILMWVRRIEDVWWMVPLGMVLGGGLGNVVDRVVRDTGGRVVDFIDLHWWPVFNIADASIVTGVGLILVLSATARAPEEQPDRDPVRG